jgi:amino acid permease
MKKLFCISMSIVIAIIVVNAVFIATLFIVSIPIVAKLPQGVLIVIATLGLILAIIMGIIIFKKIYSYIKEETKYI